MHRQARPSSVGIEMMGVKNGPIVMEMTPKDNKSWIVGRAKKLLLNTLPVFTSADVIDLSIMGFSYILAFLHLILYGSILLYFTVAGTLSGVKQKFLALSQTSTSLCVSVPVATSGSFETDVYGTWNNRQKFQTNRSVYSLKMIGITVTTEEWTILMHRLTGRVKEAGELAAGDTFGTLLGWSFFFAKDAISQVELKTTADLSSIFHYVNMNPSGFDKSSMVSTEGLCSMSSSMTATLSPEIFFLTFTLPVTLSEETSGAPPYPNPCPGQIDVHETGGTFALGLVDPAPTAGYQINFFWTQLAWAWALNFGLLLPDDLRLVTSGTIQFGALSAVLMETFASRANPYIGNLNCYSMPSKPRVCLPGSTISDPKDRDTQLGLVYPVFVSAGFFEPHPLCDSPRHNMAAISDCYTGGAVWLGLFYSRVVGTTGGETLFGTDRLLRFAWDVQQQILDKGVTAVKGQLASLIVAASKAGQAESDPSYNRGELLAKVKSKLSAFAGGRDIGLLTKQVATSLGGDIMIPINKNGMRLVDLPSFSKEYPNDFGNSSLPRGAINTANNTMYVAQALANMQARPPVSVVQPYLQCSPTLMSSFLTAAGVASGNASVFSGIFLSIFVTLFVSFINVSKQAKIRPPAEKLHDAVKKIKNLEETLAQDRAEREMQNRAHCEMLEMDRREREELRRLITSLSSQSQKAPTVDHSFSSSRRLAPSGAALAFDASGHILPPLRPEPPLPPPAHPSSSLGISGASAFLVENPLMRTSRASTLSRDSSHLSSTEAL